MLLRKLLLYFSLGFFLLSLAHGGARRFTYVYEATPTPPGAFELESWVTWKTGRANDQFDFRHEVEFGLTERLQMAIYLADWTLNDGATYTGSAVELLYGLTNPETSTLGSAIYGELKVGDELVSLESKIILQKNFGRLVFAYNATLEAEWEGEDLDERVGEFQQTLGASYEITPRFLIGAELLHEIEFPEWHGGEESVVYAGPNASLRAGNWWATVTALAQLTDADEPDVQVRTIFGYTF
jgi:hypothetical protein